jgi:hypothetical protein
MNEISFPSTQVHLLNELSKEEQVESLEETGDFKLKSLSNLEIVHHVGNPVSRFHLQRFNMTTKFMQFSTIFITAGEKNEMNTTNSDSKNIATLFLLRNIQSEDQNSGGKDQSLLQKSTNGDLVFTGKQNLCITEILDARTQKMIQSNPFLIAASDYMQVRCAPPYALTMHSLCTPYALTMH